MFVVRVLFIFVPFVCCYTHHSVHEIIMNRNVGQLINAYIKPLSDKFPDRELEVQIDIQGPPLQHYSRSISRRKIFLRQPKGKVPQSKKSESTAAPASPHAKHGKTVPTTVRVEKTTSMKIPVYKDELQKALNDLEHKINKNILKVSRSEQEPQLVISNPGPVTGGSSANMNRIIELIRRGVQFQRHVPNNDDPNMEWMQIKIPKSLNDKKSK